ncbi:hypothetical protein MCOR25_008007 [Pyricularia grisea]|uniref:Uncharacterized protein n=1 Tax=Pyricularia grisea TaxID=148305 RepID=A0A6P8AZL2_PYRGI|nr:hypothetical protein PgNI_10558 [Pyricularia grisea]KAI6356007.1 hypothetical protein MCOR25_008007 [Pyricularia grisea]TLD07765.1 hypothetical protein PgNI_10558 [Pyricularia grisea]
MTFRKTLVGCVTAALATVGHASQPGAAKPVEAPMRDLQWAQLNFLHTTDTHGWHGGHLLESQYSADWGDYISFAEHLRHRADQEGRDLLLVDTGDRIEGNGLYDSSEPKGRFTYDIFRQQDIDIICTGNHELYQADAADREWTQTVPNFKDKYIASNLDYIDPETGEKKPMAQRFRRFKTKNQKMDIIAMGFLFDFTGNANNTVVQPVEDTVKEEWFMNAIKEKPDIFVIIGHVGLRMQEFKYIFTEIRKQNWFTPIAFFGGHAHVRDAVKFDDGAYAIASGRYFETIGWMSVDGLYKDSTKGKTPVKFQRRYIDNNLLGLYHHTGLNQSTFPTKKGQDVTEMITAARKELKLDEKYGCAPQTYWMSRAPYPGNESLYTWLETEVLPKVTVNEERKNTSRLAILNTGGIRFDIFKGPFTRDSTFIVSPFTSGLNYIKDVPYEVAQKLIKLLNNGGPIFADAQGVPDMRYMASPEQWFRTEDIIVTDSTSTVPQSFAAEDYDQKPLSHHDKHKPALVGGYTTKDDISEDGDDAVHLPLSYYKVPNCIQAEVGFPVDDDGKKKNPEKVDVVFISFIQPWVLLALKFAGGDYTSDDVGVYRNGTFTEMMAEWIQENWKGDC